MLAASKSKNTTLYYVTKSIYNGGKRTSKVVERLGTLAELEKSVGVQDTVQKAKEYVKELTRKEKEGSSEIIIKCLPAKLITKDKRLIFSAGYLSLQKNYHELRIDKICHRIEDKYNLDFDLDSVLSRLVYGRIIFPSSKLATYELSNKFLEPPNFENNMYTEVWKWLPKRQILFKQSYIN